MFIFPQSLAGDWCGYPQKQAGGLPCMQQADSMTALAARRGPDHNDHTQIQLL